MEIKEIGNKQEWEEFVLSQKADTFLQSWNWGKFNSLTGEKIWRLGIFDSGNLAFAALIIKVSAKRGKFLFCPHGPVVKNEKNKELRNLFFDCLKKLASAEKADFIRISPLIEDSPENLEIFKTAGFRNAPVHMMHPELSWILDISKSEEDILKGMRKTARNLIRRAEREGVKIEKSANAADVEKFYELHGKTVTRHGFVPFSRKYLEKEMEAFSVDGQISIFFALRGGEIISSAIIVFYGDSAFYHHGASSASKIPGSYMLLWEAIREAKKKGCGKFNFWGIAPENKPNHPWAGLTHFKIGFGGAKSRYLHCQDLPVTGKYWLNWTVESFRRWKKGY